MITFLFLTLVAHGLAYLLIKFRNRAIGTTKRKDSRFHEAPGWPLLGHLPTIIANRTRTLEYNTITALKHGPGFSMTVPGHRIVDISKPEWIEYVQKTNFENYIKGPLFRTIMHDVFGDGIFVADGAAWKRARQATSTIFSIKTFKTIIASSANKSMDGLLDILKSTVKANHSIDFCDLFFRFTMDSFVQMTFGKDLGLLGTDYYDKGKASSPSKLSPVSIPFADAFDFAQDQIDFRFSAVRGWQLIEKLVGSIGKRMKASCCVLDDYAYSLIDERMASLAQSSDCKKKEGEQTDLLGIFMHTRDERGGGLGRTELRDTTLNLIIAGRDTTAEALSWAFFHLLMNKDLISKIREEAIEILGDVNEDQERVTYENYKRFIWTNAMILETLRLHPSVPKNVKCVASHDQIPGGPTVKAGDLVRWSGWQMGRDASLWGSDCGEYKPARWIDEKGSIKQFGQYKFNAFNGGPRICLGMNLAMFQAVKVIVEIFKDFDLDFAKGWYESVPKSEAVGATSRYQAPQYRSSMTLPMENPMLITIKCKN